MDDESDKISRLEDRIEQLEATTKKMMPTRRDALKFGGAAAVGAAAMSGTASAGSSQVGTIGDSNNLVDVEAEDINVSDTINGASVSGAAAGEALTSDGSGGLTFAGLAGGVPANFSYVNEESNRSLDTVFTNTTGSALYVTVTAGSTFDDNRKALAVNVDGVEIIDNFNHLPTPSEKFDRFHRLVVQFFVPDGSTYEVTTFNIDELVLWFEAEM